MYNRLNNSYFIGEDRSNGWGNRTYFTYYSQFNRESAIAPYAEAGVLGLLCIFSTAANSIIFLTLSINRSLRTVTNVFICNLALSDMLLTITGPFIGAVRITESWNLGQTACRTIAYLEFVSGSVSIWTMVMISVERFICIVKLSNTVFTHRIAIFVIVIVWTVAFIFYTPLLTTLHVRTFPFGNTTVNICTIEWPRMKTFRFSLIFTSFVLIICFFTPLVVLTHNYARIFVKFWRTRQLVKKTQTQPDSSWSKARLNIQKIRDARDLKIIKTVFGLVIVFAIMWMPIFIVFIYILLDNAINAMTLGSHVFITGLCCCMGNASVNPILYGVMNERLKRKLLFCVKETPDGEVNPNLRPIVRPNSLYSIEPIPEEQAI